MHCPFCDHTEDKVLESRETEEGRAVRRRRECLKCGERFTSYERIELRPLTVVKRDGKREQFSREKLFGGIFRACEKRPVPLDTIEALVDEVELTAYKEWGREVETKNLGELIMKSLKKTDQVAYVRFASVYRQFEDVSDFVREVKVLERSK